jgi:hypothetical protein
MELSTEKIISILPFEQEFKDKLTAQLSTMDSDTKYKVEQMLWRAYFVLYEIRLESNLQKDLNQAQQEGKPADPELYQQVELQTEKEMISSKFEEQTSSELDDVRQKLQQLSQIN